MVQVWFVIMLHTTGVDKLLVGGNEGAAEVVIEEKVDTWVWVLTGVNVVSFFSYMQFSFIVLTQLGVLVEPVEEQQCQ